VDAVSVSSRRVLAARLCTCVGVALRVSVTVPLLVLTRLCVCWMALCCGLCRWGMAWLMQWHPLIYPIKESHSDE
jgi:hypothetical protein